MSNHTEPRSYQFHHNIDIGPVGLLGEFDKLVNRQKQIEFVASEFDLRGRIIKGFDFADILS